MRLSSLSHSICIELYSLLFTPIHPHPILLPIHPTRYLPIYVRRNLGADALDGWMDGTKRGNRKLLFLRPIHPLQISTIFMCTHKVSASPRRTAAATIE